MLLSILSDAVLNKKTQIEIRVDEVVEMTKFDLAWTCM